MKKKLLDPIGVGFDASGKEIAWFRSTDGINGGILGDWDAVVKWEGTAPPNVIISLPNNAKIPVYIEPEKP